MKHRTSRQTVKKTDSNLILIELRTVPTACFTRRSTLPTTVPALRAIFARLPCARLPCLFACARNFDAVRLAPLLAWDMAPDFFFAALFTVCAAALTLLTALRLTLDAPWDIFFIVRFIYAPFLR